MKYDILEADSAAELSQLVNDAVSEGWVPLSGVSIATFAYENERDGYSETRWTYAQAITKQT